MTLQGGRDLNRNMDWDLLLSWREMRIERERETGGVSKKREGGERERVSEKTEGGERELSVLIISFLLSLRFCLLFHLQHTGKIEQR